MMRGRSSEARRPLPLKRQRRTVTMSQRSRSPSPMIISNAFLTRRSMNASRPRQLGITASEAARWERAKATIPSIQPQTSKIIRTPLSFLAVTSGTLSTQALTVIPVGTTPVTRVGNNIRLKGFKVRFHMRPDATANIPTFMRIALVVQRGTVGSPVAADFLTGPTHLDQTITGPAIANDGLTNHNQPINASLYATIWEKTVNIGPHLEAGATSVQSNLNAQHDVEGYCRYDKNIMFDAAADTTPESNNVYLVYWFDDVLRIAAALNPITYLVKGEVLTYFNELQ